MSDKASSFKSVVSNSVVVSLVGVGATTVWPTLPISIAVNIVCLAVIYRSAELSAEESREGFDAIVAAETLVAFGVFSLVLGLSSMFLAMMFETLDFEALQRGDLKSFFPFVDGLLTAGIAPLGAMRLRIRMAELEAETDATGDLAGLARATSELTRQLKGASTAVDALRTGASSAGAATVGLASSMKVEADKWGLALHEGEAYVKTFGEAAKSSSSEISSMTKATSELKKAATDVTTLMDELSRLIAAVERFVEPRSKAH